MDDKLTHFQPIHQLADHAKTVFIQDDNPAEKNSPFSISPPDFNSLLFDGLGAISTAYNASAAVPDQEHPEKYLNEDKDTIEEIIDNNLFYKDTALLKTRNPRYKR